VQARQILVAQFKSSLIFSWRSAWAQLLLDGAALPVLR
jgi:hypothetical protein